LIFVPSPAAAFHPKTGTRGTLLYTWDGLHGEVEVFNTRGEHQGVVDAVTGSPLKPARKGRKIRV